MFLIMSADYVGQELQSEFGSLPPSFLPLGNKRLFQHQVMLAPKNSSIYLSIPESYKTSNIDKEWLTQSDVNLIYVPDGLSLGASLVAALNLTNHSLDVPLHILFGDTLFSSLPVGKDIIGVSKITDIYNWAIITDDTMPWIEDTPKKTNLTSNNAVNGYFNFSKPRELIKYITQSNWHFLNALNKYHTNVGLTSVHGDNWLDFGHVNTYYRSKAQFTTQRVFNELVITPKWVEKSSQKKMKIAAEANWFESIPAQMRVYVPQLLGSKTHQNTASYRLEYLHLTALNELFVFAELPNTSWKKILASCLDFIRECKNHIAPDDIQENSLIDLFTRKTELRLKKYCLKKEITLKKKWNYNSEFSVSLEEILLLSEKHLPQNKKQNTVLHGDFCFSNILYDFRANKIKTIDPRGLTTHNKQSIYGDIRYDLAKLSHSVLGMYDWIIAGYYSIEIENYNIKFTLAGIEQHKKTQEAFIKSINDEFELTALNLYAMQIQLFLSMLPLHSDNTIRQNALFSNAFRLYKIIRGIEK